MSQKQAAFTQSLRVFDHVKISACARFLALKTDFSGIGEVRRTATDTSEVLNGGEDRKLGSNEPSIGPHVALSRAAVEESGTQIRIRRVRLDLSAKLLSLLLTLL